MTISCAITDDEPFAIKGLRKYVEDIEFLQLKGTFENALELNTFLKRQDVDLLFLDIQMPHVTGVEFLKGLKNPPLVIFTTAYEKYAIDGYELDVLDYLLKPISFERFLKAANKAYQYYQLLHQKEEDQKSYFFIKCGYRLEKIMLDEILFVESMQNYIHIHTTTGKFTTHLTLKAVRENLPANNFVQTHQSFIVNMDQIKALEGNQVIIIDHKVPISKYLKEEVLEKIVNRNLLNRK